jgi:hypothetical protein
MEVVMIVFLGVCGIILCGGLVNWVNIYLEKQNSGKKQAKELQALLEERLGELDRRLTDIQEVVLAVDEKLEHLELKQAKE